MQQAFPIQPAKVQRPPLRPDTLSRERLLSWLDQHITRRVIFVTAEAGYGKTTLLADYSRRSRRRMLWFRIDAEDANLVKCDVCSERATGAAAGEAQAFAYA